MVSFLTPQSTPIVEMYRLTNRPSQYLLIRQLLPTSELPTDVILKQTQLIVGIYVKSPVGVGTSGADWADAPAAAPAFVELLRAFFVVGLGAFEALFAAFCSLYSSIRLIRSDFSKQSSDFIPRAFKMFLSSLTGTALRFAGISTGPLYLAACYLSAVVGYDGWAGAGCARTPDDLLSLFTIGPRPSCNLYLTKSQQKNIQQMVSFKFKLKKPVFKAK